MADDLSSLLGGLLNIQQQPQVNSGLLGGLNQALSPYGGQMGLGLSLLANSNSPGGFGSILGRSALEAQQQQFQNQQQRLALAQSTLGLGLSLQKQQALMAGMGGANVPQQAQAAVATDGAPPPSAGGVAPQQSAPNGGSGPIAAPQMAMPQGQPAQSGGFRLDQIPINGQSPDDYRRTLVLGQGMNLAEANDKIRAEQIQIAQQAVAPQLAALDTAVKAASPAQIVRANPQLAAMYMRSAAQVGVNPNMPPTDASVRSVFGYARNQLAASVGKGEEAPTVSLQTVKLKDGRTAQIDPVSGKMSIEAPSALVKVRGKDGKPVFVPEGQAAGMTPYNEQMAASDDALQSAAEDVANYKLPPPTGSKLLSGNWPEVMRLVKGINPNYDATQFTMKSKARQAFASGKQGDTVRSLSVATDHLDQLSKAATAMNNGDIQGANTILNFLSSQTGHPEVTNYEGMVDLVGDEVAKAVIGGPGAEGDRKGIQSKFSSHKAPGQIQGVISEYKGLMGSQLNGFRRQYERATGLKDFDDALSPEAMKELSGQTPAPAGGQTPSPHPADIAALLNKYK